MVFPKRMRKFPIIMSPPGASLQETPSNSPVRGRAMEILFLAVRPQLDKANFNTLPLTGELEGVFNT